MARAIIRWSIDHEQSNQTGNAITRIISDAGGSRIGSATYEVDAPTMPELMTTLAQLFALVERPVTPRGELDHFWLYVDKGL